MLGAGCGEALEIALGRDQHAGRAGHGLDDDGGDGRGVVQRDEALEVVGKFGAVLGLAPAEGVAAKVVRVANVIDAGQQRAEHLAVVENAADGGAAEIDAVIAALAADQARLGGVAFGPMIGERDLERGLDELGAGVGEEHVVEARRRDIDELGGAFEGARMTHLEAAGEVELADLLADRLDDLRPAVTGIDAPQPRRSVEHAAPVRGRVVHAFGAHEQARRALILAVRRERHPKGFKIVRGKLRVHVGP